MVKLYKKIEGFEENSQPLSFRGVLRGFQRDERQNVDCQNVNSFRGVSGHYRRIQRTIWGVTGSQVSFRGVSEVFQEKLKEGFSGVSCNFKKFQKVSDGL